MLLLVLSIFYIGLVVTVVIEAITGLMNRGRGCSVVRGFNLIFDTNPIIRSNVLRMSVTGIESKQEIVGQSVNEVRMKIF
jgi:hypothetical protein